MQKLATIWQCLFLGSYAAFCMNGCATNRVASECQAPPSVLLEPCQAPSVHIETTGDLVQAIVDYDQALKICASKVEALNLYYSNTP
jgi:hypothetical protein